MRKSVIGAGFALTAAAILIVGCNKSKGSTFIGGNNGEVGAGNLPASAISQNNLSQDGGGFSNNNQTANLALFSCQFNTVNPTSDAAVVGSSSVSQVADSSAMVFFVTADNGTTGAVGAREHVFVSYFNGSAFSPPVEITGVDRDDNQGAGSLTGTHTGAVVMIPMNTSGYTDSAGTAAALPRANSGNWLILWDANTVTQAPSLSGVGTTSAGVTANANGIHHTIYATMFIKALASTPTATTALIGNTATTGAANGTLVTCNYGFQLLGTEVTPNHGGTGTGGEAAPGAGITIVNTAFVENNGGGNTVVRPAEDVISFGVASDTLVHAAVFNGSTFDQTGLLGGNNAVANFSGGALTKFALGPNVNVVGSPTNPATPGASKYTVGDNTSFIQIFWVQLITSHNNGTIENGVGGNSVNIGPNYQMWTANFDLATMTVGGGQSGTATGQTQVPYTAQRMAGAGGLAGTQLQDSTQALPTIVVYNNIVFFNYVDASMQIAQNGFSGTVEGTVGANPLQPGGTFGGVPNNNTSGGELAVSAIMEVVAVLPGVNGTAALNATVSDITLLGTNGKHNLTNSKFPVAGSTNQIDTGEEYVIFGQCAGAAQIIGPDEGQVDVVAFVLGKDTSLTSRGGGAAGNVGNTDFELWAVALNAGGATAGTLEGFTNNPRIVSAHVADVAQPSNNNAVLSGLLHDDVFDVKVQSSRDGTYDVIAYRQAQGNSESATMGLMVTVYQAYRVAAATAPTLDQRLPTTNPIVVNTGAGASTVYTATATGVTGYGDEGGFISPPVAAYAFQGHIAYHCGFQGNAKEMSIFWLYADGTNDKLFVGLLTVTLGATVGASPAITATNPTQIDAGLTVSGQGVNDPAQYQGADPGTSVAGFGTATYSFLPGTFNEVIPTYNSGNGNETVGVGAPGNGGVLIGGRPAVFSNNGGCSALNNGPINTQFDSLDSVDAGVNAAGGFGDCLIVFSKIVAGTAGNWDRNVVACLYNQSTITDRAVISNVAGGGTAGAAGEGQSVNPPGLQGGLVTPNGGFPLSGGLLGRPPTNGGGLGGTNTYSFPGSFRTCLFIVSPGVGNPSITTASLVPSVGSYIYMGGSADGTPDGARGMFTRRFRPRTSTANGATAVTFETNFFPVTSVNTTDAAWAEPTRLDNQGSDSDVVWDIALRGGAQAIVMFNQDNHVWAAVTNDGETYSTVTGKLSTPDLVDNNFSSSTNTFGFVGLATCRKIDSNCDNLHGTILVINKNDLNNNARFYIRVMQ